MNFRTIEKQEPFIWYVDIGKDRGWALRWQARDYLDEPLSGNTAAEAREEAAKLLGVPLEKIRVT